LFKSIIALYRYRDLAFGYFILPHPVHQFGNLGSGHHTFFSVPRSTDWFTVA